MENKKNLKKSAEFNGISGPLVCIVMDGIGLANDNEGNAFANALPSPSGAIPIPSMTIHTKGPLIPLNSADFFKFFVFFIIFITLL